MKPFILANDFGGGGGGGGSWGNSQNGDQDAFGGGFGGGGGSSRSDGFGGGGGGFGSGREGGRDSRNWRSMGAFKETIKVENSDVGRLIGTYGFVLSCCYAFLHVIFACWLIRLL